MTTRGGDTTKKPQKHQNKEKFHMRFNDKGEKLKTSTPLDRLCSRCLEQIKWKLQFGKYKPLTAMAKCIKCENKNIIKAYRHCCDKCSDENQICSKCLKQEEIQPDINQKVTIHPAFKDKQEAALKLMRERSRKKILRLLAKEVISFNGIIFVDNETGKEVEGILYKKSELEEDEDKEDENISDSDDFDDYDDDNDDNNDDDNDDDDFEDNNKKKKKEDL